MRKWLKLFQILSTLEAFPQKPVDNQDSLSGMFEKEEARRVTWGSLLDSSVDLGLWVRLLGGRGDGGHV